MLHYRIIGEGKPLVWLHGYLESGTMWDVFPLSELPRKNIIIDLPGHGKSALGNIECSIQAIAEEVSYTLDCLGIDSMDIIGHSLGGYVAIELHKFRNNQGKVCLFHSNFWEDDEQKKTDRSRVIEVVRKNKNFFLKEAIPNLFLDSALFEQPIAALLQEATQMTAEAIAFYAAAMRDRPSNESYALKMGEQLYVIQGEEDKIIPMDKMMAFSDRISIQVLPQAGHMGHFESTGQAFTFISQFTKPI